MGLSVSMRGAEIVTTSESKQNLICQREWTIGYKGMDNNRAGKLRNSDDKFVENFLILFFTEEHFLLEFLHFFLHPHLIDQSFNLLHI